MPVTGNPRTKRPPAAAWAPLGGLALAALALWCAVVAPGPGLASGALPGATAVPANAAPVKTYHLPKSFTGKLPITELSEDQAVLHALNRLAFGARPGAGRPSPVSDTVSGSSSLLPAFSGRERAFRVRLRG